MSAIAAGASPLPYAELPPSLAILADLADVIEGRTDLADAPLDVRLRLSWADQDRAAAARAAYLDAARWRASYAVRNGLDASDTASIDASLASLAQRSSVAEAEAIAEVASWGRLAEYPADWSSDWHRVAGDVARLAGLRAARRGAGTSLDTGQQLDIGRALDTPARARERVIESPGARVERYDRAKGALAEAIRGAAGHAWAVDDGAGAVWLDRTAARVDRCRTVTAARDAGCGRWIARPDSCHARTCPDCERSRSGRLVRRLDAVADAMATPKFQTFTIPNVAAGDLGLGIDVLLEAFAALRRLALFRGGPCRAAHDRPDGTRSRCRHRRHDPYAAAAGACGCARCERGPARAGRRRRVGCRICVHAPVRGGVYAVEVTYNATRGDWHPHLHALLDAPWMLHAELRDAWRAVTCDAIRRAEARGRRSTRATGGRRKLDRPRVRLPRCAHRADAKGRPLDGCRGASMVWIEAVKGAPGSVERHGAIRETIKYVTKGVIGADGALAPSIGPDRLAELLLALRGRRLVAGWGALRHVHDADDGTDDTLGERLAWPDTFAGFPRVCPWCRVDALYDALRSGPRVRAVPIDGSSLLAWHPPPPAPLGGSPP